MKISLRVIDEKATGAWRWSTSFAVVAVVYGTVAWLLLRENRHEVDSSGLTVMLDLPRLPDPLAAPGDFASTPIDDTSQYSSVERLADLGGEAVGGGQSPDERQVPAVEAQSASAERLTGDSGGGSIAEMSAAGAGGAKPAIGARTGAGAGGGGQTDFLAPMPIDTRITVYQGRPPNNLKDARQSKQSKQLLDIKQFNVANEFKQLQERLFRRPISIAGVPWNHGSGSSGGHPAVSAMRADAPPERNAIGVVSGMRADATPERNAIGVLRASARPTLPLGGPRETVGAPGLTSTGPLGVAVAVASERPHAVEATRGGDSLVQSANHSPSSWPGTAVASLGGPGVNGTGMARPGSLAAAIGGPAKPSAGVLNGTNFHVRQP